jgi:hypothetical protein
MEFFYSGKQPNLIGPIMKSTISKVITTPITNGTISDKIINFYKYYIIDNKLSLIIIMLFISFLVYRYYNKSNSIETQDDINLMEKIEEYKTTLSNDYYAGAHNTYEDAHDTDIQHPYEWPNDFNTTTGDFVQQMTNMNDDNIMDFNF